MEHIIQVIDPEGDTLLTLRRANAPFAVCEDKSMWPNYLPQHDGLVVAEIRELLGHATPLDMPPTIGKWNSTQMSAGQVSSETDSEMESEEDTDDEDERRTVQLIVSSKHLSYASRYFQTMLAGNWVETQPGNEYRYHISAHDWNLEALLILMNILHGRTREVPRKLDLETLAQVAALTDYYECSEAVDFFSKTWAENLEDPEPSAYGRKLLLRLSIAWVFGETVTYHKLAKIVLRSIRGPMHQLHLPGLPQTAEIIEGRRQQLIGHVLTKLQSLSHLLVRAESRCATPCSARLIGYLLIGRQAAGLGDPGPDPPFIGYSLTALIGTMRAFREPSDDNCTDKPPGHSTPRICKCKLRHNIAPIVGYAEKEIDKLIVPLRP